MSVNVAKTYNHVSHVRLLHNLKKRKISNWTIQWIKSFLKKRRYSIIFEKKNKCDKHDKRRDFAEILCFIHIILVFQCESAKYKRATKKKNNINWIRKWRERTDVQHKHRKKLQNFEKTARSLYDVISTSWSDFLFNEIWTDSSQQKSQKIQYANNDQFRKNAVNTQNWHSNFRITNKYEVKMRILCQKNTG